MAEKMGKLTVYRQQKNPEVADRAVKINLIKLAAIAVFGIIGIIIRGGDIAGAYEEGKRVTGIVPDLIYTLFGEGKIAEFLVTPIAELGELMIKPYVGYPILLASFVLTLLWKKSRQLIAVHGVLYLLLGLQFYMTWVPLLGDFWLWISLGMWVLTIVLFICALRGYRIIEVKEAEGMNSIFPEQRLANAAENGSGASSNESKNESKCDTCKRAEQGDWYLCDMCKVGDTQYKSVDEPD